MERETIFAATKDILVTLIQTKHIKLDIRGDEHVVSDVAKHFDELAKHLSETLKTLKS